MKITNPSTPARGPDSSDQPRSSAPQQTLRMVVACHNANGEPDVFSCEVPVGPVDGDQYELAKEAAREAGYEIPMVAADETDRLFKVIEGRADNFKRPGSSIVVLKTNCAPVVEEVFSNVDDVKVVILDRDTQGCEPEEVHQVEGDRVWVGVHHPMIDVLRVADVCVELIVAGVTP